MEEKEKKEEREGGGEGGREERRGNEEEKEENEEERERGGGRKGRQGELFILRGFFFPRNIAVYSAWWYFGSWGLVPSASPQCWTLGEVTVS